MSALRPRRLWPQRFAETDPNSQVTATSAGTDILVGKRDFAAVTRALAEAGYKGDRAAAGMKRGVRMGRGCNAPPFERSEKFAVAPR